MKKIFLFTAFCTVLLILLTNRLTAQTNVTIPGDFQSELGCTNDWLADCDNTALLYNNGTGLWEGTFNIPAGLWQYKVAIDHSWNENYGPAGIFDGSNIYLDLPAGMPVTFTYDPVSHVVSSSYTNIITTVVLPGSFQSELGCPGDWLPDCSGTGLTYDPASKMFVGTFTIPAGNWEYKVALNNSWAQNYGWGGYTDGGNMPLDLPVQSKITFSFDPLTHYTYLKYNTSGVCTYSFYDANANGVDDEGMPMKNVQFKVTGAGKSLAQFTDNDGRSCFENLPLNNYGVREMVPAGYFSTGPNPRLISLGEPRILSFGNICLGGGGAKCLSFWKSCAGKQALINSGYPETSVLAWLQLLNLRNGDGSDFDPVNYAQVQYWLQHANTNNMAYMLSAQEAVMFLNINLGYVNGRSIIHTPGCGDDWANNSLSYVSDFVYLADFYLASFRYVPLNDLNRPLLECMKNGLTRANDNISFVQPRPCGIPNLARPLPAENYDIPEPLTDIKIWPNPTNSYFTLQLQGNAVNDKVQVRVTDISGKQLYTAAGNAGKNYRFGEGLKAGLYFVEVVQENKRSVIKVVKQ